MKLRISSDHKRSFKCIAEKIRRAPRFIRSNVEQILEFHGREVVHNAKLHLKPIYDDAPFVPWVVTGALKGSIVYRIDRGNLDIYVISNLPYSRLRHFVNRTHPQTTGYLSIPLNNQRLSLLADLKAICKWYNF